MLNAECLKFIVLGLQVAVTEQPQLPLAVEMSQDTSCIRIKAYMRPVCPVNCNQALNQPIIRNHPGTAQGIVENRPARPVTESLPHIGEQIPGNDAAAAHICTHRPQTAFNKLLFGEKSIVQVKRYKADMTGLHGSLAQCSLNPCGNPIGYHVIRYIFGNH